MQQPKWTLPSITLWISSLCHGRGYSAPLYAVLVPPAFSIPLSTQAKNLTSVSLGFENTLAQKVAESLGMAQENHLMGIRPYQESFGIGIAYHYVHFFHTLFDLAFLQRITNTLEPLPDDMLSYMKFYPDYFKYVVGQISTVHG